jgi:hypothetical protein
MNYFYINQEERLRDEGMSILPICCSISDLQFCYDKLTGEEHPVNSDDERKRVMAKEAAVYSWNIIMFFLLLKGLQYIPFIHEAIFSDSILFFQQPFFKQGGDILLAAVIGYLGGYLKIYFKLSAR